MRFAKWVFLLSGFSGVIMITPLYFEDRFFADYSPAINRPEFSDSSYAKMLWFATENQNELQVTQQITIADQPCVDPFDVSGNSSARSLVRNARKSIRTSIPSSKLRSERLSVPSGQAMIHDHAPTSPWT